MTSEIKYIELSATRVVIEQEDDGEVIMTVYDVGQEEPHEAVMYKAEPKLQISDGERQAKATISLECWNSPEKKPS